MCGVLTHLGSLIKCPFQQPLSHHLYLDTCWGLMEPVDLSEGGPRPCLERGHPAFCQGPMGSGPCLSFGEPAPPSKAALRSGWGDCLGATPTAQGPSDHPDPPGYSDRQPNPPKAAIEPSGSHRSTLVQALSLPATVLWPLLTPHQKCPSLFSLPIDVLTWRWEWWIFVKNRGPCPSCTRSYVPAQQILHASDTDPENGGR